MMKRTQLAVAMLAFASIQATPPLINHVSISPYVDEWARTQGIFIDEPIKAARSRAKWSIAAKVMPAAVGLGVAALVQTAIWGFCKHNLAQGGAGRDRELAATPLVHSQQSYDDSASSYSHASPSQDSRSRQPQSAAASAKSAAPAVSWVLPQVDKLFAGKDAPTASLRYAPACVSAIVGGIVAGIGYGINAYRYKRGSPFKKLVIEEKRKQINRILDAWDDVAEYFPKMLRKAFADLRALRAPLNPKDYLTNKDFIVHVDRTQALVEKAIYIHNWEKKKQRPWYEAV